MLAMGAADADRCLPGVGDAATDRAQQQRTAGDRLAVAVRVRQTYEQRPPVANQCDEARHQPAPLQVLGREAAPAPLVLQLVEVVFCIAAITVELPERADFGVYRGHQSGELPDRLAGI